MSYKTGARMNKLGKLYNATKGEGVEKQQSLFLIEHKVMSSDKIDMFARKIGNVILYLSYAERE